MHLTAAGFAASCTATLAGTNFPWTATARTTSDIQIHGVNIDVFLESTPTAPGDCGALGGQTIKLTGTLTDADWLGNDGPRRIELLGSHGLVAHGPGGLGTGVIALTGTFTDTQETLAVTN